MAASGVLRVRTLVKTSAARALSWSRADALIGSMTGARPAALVLGYHRVVESFAAESHDAIPANLTSVRMFEQQIDWVGRRFRFVSIDELDERLLRGNGEPVAAVTFDDGYRDVYEHAFPMLTRKGIPAAVFVVTDLVGTKDPQLCDHLYLLLARAFARWPDAPARLGRMLGSLGSGSGGVSGGLPATALASTAHLLRGVPRAGIAGVLAALEADVGASEALTEGMRPMSWEMLAEMQRAGVVVGSHTQSHRLLPLEAPEIETEELVAARRAIEARLGGRVRHFAYPDGQFVRRTVAAVSAAGYERAYTTCTYRDPEYPMLTVPRLMLWEKACVDGAGGFSSAILSCQAHGLLDLMGRCEHEHRA